MDSAAADDSEWCFRCRSLSFVTAAAESVDNTAWYRRCCWCRSRPSSVTPSRNELFLDCFVPAPAVTVLAPAGVVVQYISASDMLLRCTACETCKLPQPLLTTANDVFGADLLASSRLLQNLLTILLGIGVAVGADPGLAVSRQAETSCSWTVSFLLRPLLSWPQQESSSKTSVLRTCCCVAQRVRHVSCRSRF